MGSGTNLDVIIGYQNRDCNSNVLFRHKKSLLSLSVSIYYLLKVGKYFGAVEYLSQFKTRGKLNVMRARLL